MKAVQRTCLGLLLTLIGMGAIEAEPQHVLLIHWYGRDFAPFHTFSGVLRTELASQSPEPVDFSRRRSSQHA